MTLPTPLRKTAESVAEASVYVTEYTTHEAFMVGVEWLYAYLSVQQYRMVTSDEEVAAFDEQESYKAFGEGRNPRCSSCWDDGARWQHAQTQAHVAALRAELAEIKQNSLPSFCVAIPSDEWYDTTKALAAADAEVKRLNQECISLSLHDQRIAAVEQERDRYRLALERIVDETGSYATQTAYEALEGK